MVAGDPHGTLVETGLFKTMQYGLLQTGAVIYDHLADTQSVPGYTFLESTRSGCDAGSTSVSRWKRTVAPSWTSTTRRRLVNFGVNTYTSECSD